MCMCARTHTTHTQLVLGSEIIEDIVLVMVILLEKYEGETTIIYKK